MMYRTRRSKDDTGEYRIVILGSVVVIIYYLIQMDGKCLWPSQIVVATIVGIVILIWCFWHTLLVLLLLLVNNLKNAKVEKPCFALLIFCTSSSVQPLRAPPTFNTDNDVDRSAGF
jgi:hypothetical protein